MMLLLHLVQLDLVGPVAMEELEETEVVPVPERWNVQVKSVAVPMVELVVTVETVAMELMEIQEMLFQYLKTDQPSLKQVPEFRPDFHQLSLLNFKDVPTLRLA